MSTATQSYRTISVHDLARVCDSGRPIDLIDVRTPVEFREVHSVHARNVPLDALDPADVMARRTGDESDPIYLICRSGTRGGKACEAFLKAGYTNVVNVDGGTSAWDAAGLPVKRGKKTVSLERQVRIAAGFLVLLGAALGLFAHPYWIGLAAFVGAGLMFSGITDTCGMAMILARMPWNRAPLAERPAPQTPTGGPHCCSL